jgi:hypothetical protein
VELGEYRVPDFEMGKSKSEADVEHWKQVSSGGLLYCNLTFCSKWYPLGFEVWSQSKVFGTVLLELCIGE